MRVSHLAAMATLIALLGAMFIAMGSASAAGCVANPGITLGFGKTCEVDADKAMHAGSSDAAVADVETTPGDDGMFTITADADTAGIATVTLYSSLGADGNIGGEGTSADTAVASFDVTVVGFGIAKVEIVGDNDNVVSAGAAVTARATLRSHGSGAQVSLTVPTTGLSIAQTVGSEQTRTTTQSLIEDDTQNVNDGVYEFTVNTAGAPTGDYTLTFVADNTGFSDNATTPPADGERASATLTLTIGDPGTGLASATLSLGNSKADIPYTSDNEATPESGTAPAVTDGDGIQLVIEAFDSRDGKANSSAISQVIVIAPGGVITTTHDTGANDGSDNDIFAGGPSSATLSETDADTASPDDVSDVGQKTVIYVKKAGGSSAKPGMVTVYAIVSGSGGAATTESLTLNFSGKTSSISIGDATDTLRSVNVDADDSGTVEDDERDSIKLAVTGSDEGGIANDPGEGYNITITDPDGKRVNSNKIEAMLATAYAGGKRDLTLTGKGAPGAALMAGEYTVMLKKGSLEASAMFSVAGSASDVMVSASATTSDTIGDVITVTAEITDADGNPVSDGTSVQFDVSSNTGLAAIGTGHMGKDTKDGMASVKYAVVGAGHSVVSATAGGATGVIVIDSTAGMVEEEAMPEEEASVSCLSELSGFATWSCGVEADASAIFDMVTGRGVSAIHLWNGSTWVRYSVVDDAMVPGSSDFMVTENDILYISN